MTSSKEVMSHKANNKKQFIKINLNKVLIQIFHLSKINTWKTSENNACIRVASERTGLYGECSSMVEPCVHI